MKGAYDPDDSVWMLDLNRPLISPKSDLGGNISEEFGVQVYPAAKDANVRHRFSQLVIGKDGQDVFLADRIAVADAPSQVCFVRIDLSVVNQATNKRNCVDEKSLTGYFPKDIQATGLTINSFGLLIYSVVAVGTPRRIQDFNINPVMLVPSATTPPPRIAR